MTGIVFCPSEKYDVTGAFACLKMIFRHYNEVLSPSAADLERYSVENHESLIWDISEKSGLRCVKLPVSNADHLKEISTPFMLRSPDNKYMVVQQVSENGVQLADPFREPARIKWSEFSDRISAADTSIYVFQPTLHFYNKGRRQKSSMFHYASYLKPYRKYLFQILLGLLIGSILQFLPPFLAQVLVDKGIGFRDLTFVNMILIGLILVQLGKVVSQVIREWINFYIGNRVNITIVSDFIHRILNLPVPFVEGRNIGDILQRVGDHKRVETFLTRSLVSFVFGLLSLVIFWSILLYYNTTIFLIFTGSSVLLFGWSFLLLSLRRRIDANIFRQNARSQNTLIQMLQSAQDIKLQGNDNLMRWEWEKNQVGLYKAQLRMLQIDQGQIIGTTLINEIKNILILYVSANLVISGEITIGMMLAIQYVMGQANQPVYQSVRFLQEAQMAAISLRRLAEINEIKSETENESETISTLPENKTISLTKVSFKYGRSGGNTNTRQILKNINLMIPQGKVTCIIGPSGCGKTTLIKLLLKFYQPTKGEIRLDTVNFVNIKTKWWRSKCGAILQDSTLMNDTVLNNICGSEHPVDMERILNCVKLANIQKDIEAMPLQYNTRIGSDGVNISPGQRQRFLLARLFYKSPSFIFLDEATNAIDQATEELVLDNFFSFFRDKTVVMVTHRLHTLKYADNLIVMDNGEIVEFGHPQELLEKKGSYFQMIKSKT